MPSPNRCPLGPRSPWASLVEMLTDGTYDRILTSYGGSQCPSSARPLNGPTSIISAGLEVLTRAPVAPECTARQPPCSVRVWSGANARVDQTVDVDGGVRGSTGSLSRPGQCGDG